MRSSSRVVHQKDASGLFQESVSPFSLAEMRETAGPEEVPARSAAPAEFHALYDPEQTEQGLVQGPGFKREHRVFEDIFDFRTTLAREVMLPIHEYPVCAVTATVEEAVRIRVGDTGRGLPGKDRDKLFLPYFSTKKGGTGLGLAIVSDIISEHRGDIRVEDNSPQGTVFIIDLPLNRTAARSSRGVGMSHGA